MSDSTVIRWIKLFPLCNNLESFAGVSHEISEQQNMQKELRTSRPLRDNHDADSLLGGSKHIHRFRSVPDYYAG